MSSATMQAKRTNEFFILGPPISRGNKVLDAVHALYYLPDNYKLVFMSGAPHDQTIYNQLVSLVERDALNDRVRFSEGVRASDAIIVPEAAAGQLENGVHGSSPEALASSILHIAKQR